MSVYATVLRASELVDATLVDIEPDARGDHWLKLVGKGRQMARVALPPLDRHLVERRLRQCHLERAVTSAATFLAAASQRTTRIGLGAAVIQMGHENLFRLAEDLATVDVLSRGGLNIGLSAGALAHGILLGDRLFDSNPELIDFSHARVERLRRNLAGEWLGEEDALVESAAGRVRPRVSPFASGLTERLWYGGGSQRSIEWAGRNGFNLLIGNITTGEGTDDYRAAQRHQLELYRSHWRETRAPRIALGRVIVPTDGADAGTRQRYSEFAEGRHARTLRIRAAHVRK